MPPHPEKQQLCDRELVLHGVRGSVNSSTADVPQPALSPHVEKQQVRQYQVHNVKNAARAV
jgi:hypothetical protein